MDFAIIKTGGKQYKVKAGDTVKVEKLTEEKTVNFDDILSGKKVTASIVNQGKGPKVTVVKHRPKKRYKRVIGHRQSYTEIRIDKVA